MKFYHEQLQKLQEQVARKQQLEIKVAELRTQRNTLSARVRELNTIKTEEQADVDKLDSLVLNAALESVVSS